MINNDELWRTLELGFYEVDARTTPLAYGDVIVFIEPPKGAQKTAISYRDVKHTATYLFGRYVFSKGSKSPNTPYTVKTLKDEWDTWVHISKNIGIKVFRRSSVHATTAPGQDSRDWLY